MEKLDISVLYVEDEPIIQQSVAAKLIGKVKKLFLAKNGKIGFELFEHGRPDVVVTDIQMPVMNGLEMLCKIKEKSENVKIVILTAFSDSEYLIKAIDLGVDKFIMKPVKEDKIYDCLVSLSQTIHLEKRVREEQKKFRVLSSSAQDAIFMMDDKFRVTLWNAVSEQMFGYENREISGKKIYEFIIPPENRHEFKLGMKNFSENGNGKFVGKITELSVIKKDGKRFSTELSLSSVKLGNIWHAIGIVRDITERKKSKEQLQKAYQKMDILARTDFLTKISSRWDVLEKIKYEIQRFERFRYPFALIISDIDSFKSVNDTFGHDVGDKVLQHISDIMKKMVRRQDVLGRWGGEEFIMMLPRTEIDGAKIICERIRQTIMDTPFIEKDIKIQNTMTFGIGIYDKEMNIDECIKQADEALYYGKETGKNCVVIFREMAKTE
ncbi:MAG: diguanylate cyclase [Candidatus Cloacimonadota bacterium]|nr:diguanylate cyclase [Candidatus Cloacimonadota bacterium]